MSATAPDQTAPDQAAPDQTATRIERLPPLATVERAAQSVRTQLIDPRALPVWLDAWRTADEFAPTPHEIATPAWSGAWVEAFGDTVECHLAVRSIRDGADDWRAVGFWLVVRSTHRRIGPFAIRTIHVGTAGESPTETVFVEHNRPWLRADRDTDEEAAAFLDDIVDLTAALPADRFDADGVPSEIVALSQRLRPADTETRSSPCLTFPDGFANGFAAALPEGGDIFPLLRRKTRSNVRRARKAYGAIAVDWKAGDEAHPLLDTLIELHQARWKAVGQSGAFGKRVERFYRRLLDENRLAVAVASDESGPIGATLLAEDDGRALCLIVGFADIAVRASPGMVSLVPIMEEAARRGHRGFEYLVGESLYKRMLTNGERSLVWAQLPRRNARMLMAQALRGVLRAVRSVRTLLSPSAASRP